MSEASTTDFEQEDRDAEIARLLHEGLSHREIATRLGVSGSEPSRVRKQLGIGRTEFKRTPKPVEAPAPRAPAVVYPLPVVSRPADTFRCGKYACVLTARACVIRQGAEAKDWVGSTPLPTESTKHSRQTGKTTLFNAYCRSGECAQGNAVKKQLSGHAIEPPRKVDWHAQAVAKRRKAGPLITAAVDRGGEVKAERASVPPRAAAEASPPRLPEQQEEEAMPKKSKLATVSDEDFRKAWIGENGSASAVARHFDVSWQTIRNRCIKLGLTIQPKGSNGSAADKPAVPKPPRAPRVAPPAPTHSDPGSHADEFERMRRIVEDYQALSREGRLYVPGRLTSLS